MIVEVLNCQAIVIFFMIVLTSLSFHYKLLNSAIDILKTWESRMDLGWNLWWARYINLERLPLGVTGKTSTRCCNLCNIWRNEKCWKIIVTIPWTCAAFNHICLNIFRLYLIRCSWSRLLVKPREEPYCAIKNILNLCQWMEALVSPRH